MSLTPEDVKKIALLGRLAIDEAQIEGYAQGLSGILDFVAQMDAIDTADVAPMAHPLDTSQRLRVDDVAEVDAREVFQANAPAVEAGLYLVPKVIE